MKIATFKPDKFMFLEAILDGLMIWKKQIKMAS